jgi:threonine dehydratase
VYVPDTAPPVKVARLREYGAEVVQGGARYADAYEAGAKHASQVGALFCHPYDQPEVCAGQGTLGRELLEQAPFPPSTPPSPQAGLSTSPSAVSPLTRSAPPALATSPTP